MIRPVIVTATLALLLGACGDKNTPATSEDDARKARGEVLGGSISDDMIALDTLTSEPPPMKSAPGDGASGAPQTGATPATPATDAPAPAEDAAQPAPAAEEQAEN